MLCSFYSVLPFLFISIAFFCRTHGFPLSEGHLLQRRVQVNKDTASFVQNTYVENTLTPSPSPLHHDDADWSPSPLLAIITEPDAVSSRDRLEQTVDALSNAMQSGFVDLISIRCVKMEGEDQNSFQQKVIELSEKVIKRRDELKKFPVKRLPKVVINDNLAAVLASNADGIHIKERNVKDIVTIRDTFNQNCINSDESIDKSRKKIIGTSCHSIESGKEIFALGDIDYLFVGTCYMTQSHPEKTVQEDLEGPSLPGLVRQTVFIDGKDQDKDMAPTPKIFAIGGINENNCWEPVQRGADGVALIRSVMQANDPKSASTCIHESMKNKKGYD